MRIADTSPVVSVAGLRWRLECAPRIAAAQFRVNGGGWNGVNESD